MRERACRDIASGEPTRRKPMSANDAIVLQTNFQAWKARALDLKGIDPWLYYCVEQFVKPLSLDDDEIQYGITDGGNDGGADGIYFLVNQRQLVEEDTELEAKGVSKIRIIFLQIKTSGGFKPTEIEKWISLTDDFFDLSKPAGGYGTRYNNSVIKIMRTWKEKYLNLIGGFPPVSVDYYYITGDDAFPDEYAIDAGNRVKAKLAAHLKCDCEVHYVGAQQLWEQVQRRPPKAKTLIWSETPMSTIEGFVGLVKLKDFFEFLQDEPLILAERIFESNVRGYQQSSSVNKQIRSSLEDSSDKANFWLVNNGVTIIASNAASAGHLRLSIEDPQIVNGLQTSRELFSYFSQFPDRQDNRSVLVRVIQTKDPEVQDLVIRATNSQNKMAPASLRMTDQIHRNIEELFLHVDLYYDRRKGLYRDLGKPIRKIISINSLAQAVISVILQRPDDARGRPGDYFRKNDQYKSIFASKRVALGTYLSCVQIVRRIESYLETLEIDRSDQKNLKFYVAALVTREITGQPVPQGNRLPVADTIADSVIAGCYERVRKVYDKLALTVDRDTVARGTEMLKQLTAKTEK